MPTAPLRFIGVRYPVIWSMVIALLLLIALLASFSFAKPVLATAEPTRSPSAQFTTSELSTTYLIIGQVSSTDGLTDIFSNVILHAGNQYSATLDPHGFFTMTGVVAGVYEIRGEVTNHAAYDYYVFEPSSRWVRIPPSAANQAFMIFHAMIDPDPPILFPPTYYFYLPMVVSGK